MAEKERLVARHPGTWRIEYCNDVGPDDGGFGEWWQIEADGSVIAKFNDERDAMDVLAILARAS